MPTRRPLKLDEYGIPKARYMELLYFCQQYPEWEDEYKELHGVTASKIAQGVQIKGVSNPTAWRAEKAIAPLEKMKLVEQTAIEASADLHQQIVKNVCYQMPYEFLKPPCGRRQFYELRRRFFYLLSKKR